jgi:hypothetical protein
MRTRDLLVGIAMLGGVVVACSDAFGVEDALGIWDVRAFNGRPVPGDVWVRVPEADSVELDLEEFWIEFMASGACGYATQLEGEAPFETDDCTYTVTEDGAVALTLLDDFTLAGSGDGTAMTLTDEEGNVLELRKRS